ncbi:MAG: glycosyltransferase family 2 protein [Acidimicrobiales bacterium]|nr:glycosyltransferase family 2 protein [Acidimicrobiales bacterium]MCB9394920.1 glycosyltransferase family 2 protein [Acidimicrobiaceae bacterium]
MAPDAESPTSSTAGAGVLVVVPAYNERDCIAAVVDDVRGAGYDCLVVDDGSRDETAEIAAAHGAAVVRLPINLGVGGALRTGFRYATDHGYHTVVQVDADGQHVTDHIRHLLEAVDTADLDMAVGSRFLGHGDYRMPFVRRWAVRVLAAVIRSTGKAHITDPTSGFRAIRRPLLDAFAADFPAHYLGDTFEALLVSARRGYRLGEVPVAMRERQGGRPSADLSALVQSVLRAFTILLTGTTFDLPPRSGANHRAPRNAG